MELNKGNSTDSNDEWGTSQSMELRHLRHFVAAAEELNLTRASQRLNISQPAVSRQIRELECELGSPLFTRQRFGLSLTPASAATTSGFSPAPA